MKNIENFFNKYRLPLALEIFEYAERKATLHEYKKFVAMQPTTISKNPHDRKLVLNFLLEQKIIGETPAGTLFIDPKINKDWLFPYLEKGEQNAWRILNDYYPKNNMFLKFDDSKNKKIGADGEEFVVSELRRSLDEEKSKRVNHVAIVNDTLGYDVESPVSYSNTAKIFIEVKTNSNPFGTFRCFLSRNEYKISQKNKDWYLVLVRLINGLHILEGYIPGKNLANIMPNDDENGISRWESASLLIDDSMMEPGLPI